MRSRTSGAGLSTAARLSWFQLTYPCIALPILSYFNSGVRHCTALHSGKLIYPTPRQHQQSQDIIMHLAAELLIYSKTKSTSLAITDHLYGKCVQVPAKKKGETATTLPHPTNVLVGLKGSPAFAYALSIIFICLIESSASIHTPEPGRFRILFTNSSSW